MEKSKTEHSAMVIEYENDHQEIEFVAVDNDFARVEPTADAENQITVEAGENWDNDDTLNNNNLEHVAEHMNPLNPFTNHNVNNELVDYPNVEQLSVQPFNEEVNGETITVSELIADPDACSRGSLRFRFKIENLIDFCSRSSKVASDVFTCRDIPFNLIVMNKVAGQLSISAYLMRCSTGDPTKDTGLDIVVSSCEISVHDGQNVNLMLKSFSSHVFRAGSDWGFCEFLNASIDPSIIMAIRNDNSLTIQVQIKTEPPHCTSDSSKVITGCVGIENQGATCYMNSLLQVLFFLTKFRTACYRIPTEMDDRSSMALALQKVFYNLQFSDTAVSTKNLTKSFGWSNVDVLMQHDIQEMMRVLIEKIESRMKNTLLEPILPKIFQGKFVSYVKCRDIEFSSQREEVFYDIQLSLDNNNNVYDSFRRYVSPEMMDDDNKYHAGSHGLQAAEKGTLFISLPPVMFLHLLRFQFDGVTNQVMKNNNFFEFYEHIDLTEFVREDEKTTWKYTLFAVLSHSGGGSHGHYVAYIDPALKGHWLKFDDDTISLVHRCDAIDANFGSNNDVDEWTKSMQLNAYMLVYVRDCDADVIFEPVDPKYISEELQNAVKKEPEESHYNNLKPYNDKADVYVFLSTFLESEFRFKFARADRPFFMPKFSLCRYSTASAFKKELQSAFNITGDNQIRLWPIMHRSNYYSHPIYIDEDSVLVDSLLECRDKYSFVLSVWVEMAEPGTELPPFDREKDVLTFYYFYCARECRPCYMNHGYHDKDSKVEELIPILNRLMGWSNRELNIYQDVRETKCFLLSPSECLSNYAQLEANTLTMHVVFEAKVHDESTKLNNISSFYQDLLFRVNLIIRNADHQRAEEYIEFSLQSTFPELMEKLAGRLNYDKKKIQVFNSHQNRDIRGDPIPSTTTKSLKMLLNGSGMQRILLFYKLHPVDVIDVETKHNFTFQSLPIDMKKPDKFTLYLKDGETIDSILGEAAKVISLDPVHGSGKLRILSVHQDGLSVVKDSKEIYKYIEAARADGTSFHKRRYFRIEEIPKGEDILNDNEKYVVVLQSRLGPQARPPIYSFIFKVKMNEAWQSVKERLRCRLNLSETVWSDCRPVILLADNEEVEMDDDTKCLNDLNSTFSIRLNYYKSKPTHFSHSVNFQQSL